MRRPADAEVTNDAHRDGTSFAEILNLTRWILHHTQTDSFENRDNLGSS